jgi:hypothetical protein
MHMVEIQRLFQLQMPEYALTEPHLMRGLMALSAFHLAYKRPAEASIWMPLAFKHQAIVLRSLRMILANINRENCQALFCLSAIVGLTSLSSSSWAQPIAPGGVPDMSEIIQPLILLRGTSELGRYAQELQELFVNGPMSAFVRGYFIMSDTKKYMPESAAIQFEKLKQLIIKKYSDETRQNQLIATLKWLEKIYSEVAYTNGTANGNMCMVWKWISHVSEAYIGYLKELDPAALVIFGYFSILSDIFKSYWYLHNWADRALKGIDYAIKDPDFKEAMRWAENQVKSKLDIFPREDHSKVPVQVQ